MVTLGNNSSLREEEIVLKSVFVGDRPRCGNEKANIIKQIAKNYEYPKPELFLRSPNAIDINCEDLMLIPRVSNRISHDIQIK